MAIGLNCIQGQDKTLFLLFLTAHLLFWLQDMYDATISRCLRNGDDLSHFLVRPADMSVDTPGGKTKLTAQPALEIQNSVQFHQVIHESGHLLRRGMAMFARQHRRVSCQITDH